MNKSIAATFEEDLIKNLVNQGFHLIDNFLEVSHYQSLLDLAKSLDKANQFSTAKIGQQTHAAPNFTIRQDKIYWLDNASTDPALNAYFLSINQIKSLLNQTLFLNLNDFEAHFAIYPPGAFYKKHVDQFKTTNDRRISCVYYLNDPWQETFGGELRLYNQADLFLQSIQPHSNRFICFRSDLPHEVCLTHHPRYSIAGWMKVRSKEIFPDNTFSRSREKVLSKDLNDSQL